MATFSAESSTYASFTGRVGSPVISSTEWRPCVGFAMALFEWHKANGACMFLDVFNW